MEYAISWRGDVFSGAPQSSSAAEVDELDPYAFFAVLGKRVIHAGGRMATDQLIRKADFQPGQRVLDVGCGVATTAIEICRRFEADVTAIDIAPLMLERATANVGAARMQDRISVETGDITAMRYADNAFDRVIAEAVTMFVDRSRATSSWAKCGPACSSTRWTIGSGCIRRQDSRTSRSRPAHST